MSFIARLQLVEPVETWPAMEAAAEERFLDGLALASGTENRTTGAIYLFGYTAEMLLKVAYFRFTNVPRHENLRGRRGALDKAQNHAAWHGRNLHDLVGWMNLLLDERAAQNRALDIPTAGLLQLHVRVLDGHWREVLRYKQTPATITEMDEVYTSVDWLRTNYDQIGS